MSLMRHPSSDTPVPNSTQPRCHMWPVRVYYEDTDAAGVVYYANYLKFCERGRAEWLREVGMDQIALRAERNLVFVVRSVQADYLRPAQMDDALQVVTHIGKVGGASLRFEQTVQRQGEVLLTAQVVVACVDWQKQCAVPLPPDVRQAVQSWLNNVAPA